ncbi:beta-ketoacyl-ACP synthase II [Allonocardiopsis opalescens]|uniref:3-oxoacyl-[acyl-carrier-protein] synthase 2 n=1 Tax=Allonocardiopsis opalescens TaxID=1144618 RepID=A0A2T0PUV3_9ACTN|nr:beta-ketoacyl-ACP synthase II [Allonocardiopsis opalescens]PRX92506.1 3-oxoacyl-[acyl-carrier-protein] synthase II [Allonocardiopsis opalescens]
MGNTSGVVVTGLGATTPLGGDVPSTWSALLAGHSGVRALTDDWAEALPVRFAAAAAVDPAEVLPRVRLRRLDRTQQFAVIAAREAWSDAGEPEVDPVRLAVSVSSGIGGILTTLNQYDVFRERGWQRVSPFTVPMLMPNGPAGALGVEYGARAGTHAMVSACASSAESIGYGIDMIRGGRADVVIAGGVEASIHPLNIAAFASMRAMSTRNDDPERASRPFDRGRDGFVMAEGAGILVLESEEHARARGARIYAEAAGAGYSSDGYDMVLPHPEGEGAARAIEQSLRQAEVAPGDIAYANAHATSTPAGDVAETRAIRSALGDAAADRVVVSSTKSMTGHLLGGAGAVESIATVLALHHRQAPPTINIEDLDDGVAVEIIQDKSRDLPQGPLAALNNSFGFGGHNVALVFRHG